MKIAPSSILTPRHRVFPRGVQRGRLCAVLVGTGVVLSSCVVWKEDYDVLAAKQRNEAAAHAAAKHELSKSRQELMALQSKLQRIETQLSDSQRRLNAHEESLAQAEFQHNVVEQQKLEATQLVEQLRSELERLAAHFQAYASDREALTLERERLSQELETAEGRLKALAIAQERAQQRLEMVRDLSVHLREQIEREQVSLLFDGDVVVLRMAVKSLYGKKGLTTSGKRLLRSVGSALVRKTDDEASAERGAGNGEAKQTEAAAAAEPRLVVNEWEEGERKTMSQQRLQLLREQLVAAGVSAGRFAPQQALVDYQMAVRQALEAPVKLNPPAVPEISADRETRILASSVARAPVEPWTVDGRVVTLHLVPAS